MSENSIMSQEKIEELLRNAGQVDAAPLAMDLDLNSYFTRDEQDALGEMGNICMGTAATTMYTLLGRKVMITTPHLSLQNRETLAAEHPLPLVVVEVQYTQGLSGHNLLLLKEYDVALITDLLMGGSGNIDPDNIVLDEISLSAIREVMNQMVGSSSTSLASMLQKTINISTPASRRILISEDTLSSIFQEGEDTVLKISFKMEIENLLTSEIMQVLPIDFSREVANELLNPGVAEDSSGAATAVQPQIVYEADCDNRQPAPQMAPQSAPQAPPPQAPATYATSPSGVSGEPGQPQMHQPCPPGYYPNATSGPVHPQPPQPGAMPDYGRQQQGGTLKNPANVNVKDVEYPVFSIPGIGFEDKAKAQNLWRLLDVPMEVTVELGRCTKTIKQVLDLNVGSVVVLDKLAGEMVEILVNGIQVARGEVVVIDDSYGVRITELNAAEISEITKIN